MKNLLQKAFFFVLIALFLGGCKTQYMAYNRDRIIKKNHDYEVFLNGEKIVFDTIYLDKDNIESVKIHRQEKRIDITQINKEVKYFSPQEEDFSSRLSDLKHIIINGKHLEDTSIKIETSAIKHFEILRNEDFQHRTPGSLLIITLK